VICFQSPGGVRLSGKSARLYFMHRNVLCLGNLQHMHFPSDF